MIDVRAARTAMAVAVLVTALGACSSAGSAKGPKASSQASVSGCDVLPDTPPGRILELSIAQEFFDEHLFADPAPAYKIIAQGKVVSTTDFNQWWDKYEGDRILLLGGETMADWETELMQRVFPERSDVYARYCGGWRFSTYLKQRLSASPTKDSVGASPSAT